MDQLYYKFFIYDFYFLLDIKIGEIGEIEGFIGFLVCFKDRELEVKFGVIVDYRGYGFIYIVIIE